MQYVNLGRAGAKVSRLCLGTMNFGPEADEKQSHAILDRALELGINFIDTANVYGWDKGKGTTEEILGKWFAKGEGRRERTVLATKLYGKMGDGPNDWRCSAVHIRKACEDSLKRLQTDHIDLYQMHHIDRETPWEEVWQAMELLVQQGKVLYIGSSNFAGWHITQGNEKAKQRNFFGLVTEQSIYSLRNRAIETEVIPACRDYGMGVLAWSPLAGGLLAGGALEAKKGRRAHERLDSSKEKLRPNIEAYEAFCREIGKKPAHVALAWVLANPGVTAPIIGPRTLDQLEDSLGVLETMLGEEEMKKLDEIWPGPGGTAPEAYAW